jgi:hypothetical protein
VQVGDLVRTTRASILWKKGQVGIVEKVVYADGDLAYAWILLSSGRHHRVARGTAEVISSASR